MRFSLYLLFFFILASTPILAQVSEDPEKFNLPRHLTEEELTRMDEIGMFFQPTSPPAGPVRNIAEYERNEAVMVRYSAGAQAWPLDLIAALSEDVRVITLVANNTLQNQAFSEFSNAGVNMDNVEFMTAPTNSVWTRDYGPFWIANEDHQVSIVDFVYNRPRPLDDAVPEQLGLQLGIPVYGMVLIHTGGNYMTDGWGIGASTDLIFEENGAVSINEDTVLNRMKAYMNIDTYHVTIDPQASAIKHIDTWAKFLDTDKILIARVPPNHPRYEQHELVANYFESQPSSYGTNYQVFRVDTPNGQPYTNSLIVNERVYVPLMSGAQNTQWNQAAIEAYEEAMPGYEVLGFFGNPGFNWNSSDALHCRVKEIPDRGMLHMHHKPISGVQEYQDIFDFDITIIPYSGEPVIQDSLFFIYSFNEAPFDTLTLTQVEDFQYNASLPVPLSGGEITYYFYAADESGRQENFPLIGREGARSFVVEGTSVNIPQNEQPQILELAQNYPNPFNPTTTIPYTIEETGLVNLSVFDLLGRQVAVLKNEVVAPGSYSANFDASSLSSGSYFYRLEFTSDTSGKKVQTRIMTLVK